MPPQQHTYHSRPIGRAGEGLFPPPTPVATATVVRRLAVSTPTSVGQRAFIRVNMKTTTSDCTGTSALLTKVGVRVPSGLPPSGRLTTSTNTPRNSTPPFKEIPNGADYASTPASTGTRTGTAMRGIVDNPRR